MQFKAAHMHYTVMYVHLQRARDICDVSRGRMCGDSPFRNCPANDGKTQAGREESKSFRHQKEHAPNY